MSSSEDYLDNLLNAVKNEAGEMAEKPNNEKLLESLQQLDNGLDESSSTDESNALDDAMMDEPVIEDIMPEETGMNDLLMDEPAIDTTVSKPEDDDDVTALIDSMHEDSELAEISDLLKKSDNNEMIDDEMLSLLENADHSAEESDSEEATGDELFDFFANELEELPVNDSNEETAKKSVETVQKRSSAANDTMQSEIDELLGNSSSEEYSYNEFEIADPISEEGTEGGFAAEEDAYKGKRKKERVKKEKKGKRKKENIAENTESEEGIEGTSEEIIKKPGLLKKLFGALFEEDEEPEKSKELGISDENQEILDEIAEEGIKNKKGGKKDKKEKKKGKKKEGNTEGDSLEEDDEDSEDNKKEKKPKKEKKVKKEKIPEELEPGKKISVKKVIPVFLFCLTIMMIIIVLAMIVPSYQDLKNARNAYYQGDYRSVYYDMYGKDLSESDDLLYRRSVAVLTLQNYVDSYQMYLQRRKETEAVNELLMAVMFYDEKVRNNTDIDVIDELEQTYQEVLALLSANYNVSEERALEIVALEDLPYNKELYYLVYGVEFSVPGQETFDNAVTNSTDVTEEGRMEDVLTEEEDLTNEGVNAYLEDNTDNSNFEGSASESSASEDGQNNDNQTENTENTDQNDESNVIYSGVVENGSAFMQ